MRKLKLLLTAFALLGGVFAANAQTDVTSTYLTNADFSSTTPVTGTYLYGYGKDGTPYGYQTVDGWTSVVTAGDNSNASYPNSGTAAGVFSYGSSTQLKGNAKAAPAKGPNSEDGKCFGFFGVWGCGGYYYQSVTLNPGSYKIIIPMYNQSGTQANTTYTGFFPTSGTNRTVAVNPTVGSWSNQTVSFTLEEATEGQIRIGYQSAGKGSGDNPHIFIDRVTIICTDFKAELRTVIAQAQAINARISTLESDITTAQSVLNTASASKTTIDGAVTTLRSAISTKLAAYTGLNAEGDDITSFIANNGFEISPTFNGTSIGTSGSASAVPTEGSTLLLNAANVYQINGWELLTTETSDFARTFTMPYNTTLYVQGNNNPGGQAVTSPTNGSSVTTSNDNLLFVETNWCENAILGVKQTIPLCAGSYRLTFDTYVTTTVDNAQSRCGVSYGETTDYKWPAALNTWTTNEVDFTLDDLTDVTISMGYKKINNVGGGSSAFLFVDNVKLTYFDPLKLAQIQWQETWDALDALDETALPDAAGTAITDALEETEPTTVDGYNSAKDALQALIDSYDGIKAAYDKVNALIILAQNEKYYSDGNAAAKSTFNTAISTAITNKENRTTADALEGDYTTLEAARETYITGGAEPDAGHPFDYTFKLSNPSFESTTEGWTLERNTTGTWNYDIRQNEPIDGNDNLNAWAQQINYINVYQNVTLPRGSYSLKGYLFSDLLKSQHIYANNGTDNPSSNLASSGSWERLTADFKQTSESSVKLGIYSQGNNVNNDSYGWFRADHFQLFYNGIKPVLVDALADAISDANAIKSSNVGSGAFQIPTATQSTYTSAIATAQGVYEDGSATASAVQAAINDLNTAKTNYINATVNGPASGVQYRIKSTAADAAGWKNKYYWLKKDENQANGGYSTRAEKDDAAFWATAWKFTSVSGNTYKLSMIDADGHERYLCTNITGYGVGSATQIRTTTDAEKALVVKVIAATGTDGRWFLQNTEDNSYLGGQDAGLFSNSQNYDLAIEAATKASVTVNIPASQQYATAVFPFTPSLPSGVKAYSCAEAPDNVLTLVEAATPAANVPYILENTSTDVNETLQDWGSASAGTYTAGLLTGVYTETEAPDGSYVLAKINDKVAFYLVDNDDKPTVGANRCYLTAPAGARAFYFPGEETGIEAINALTSGEVKIFNASGAQIPALQKGMNIVKQSNGKSYKVIVK